MPEPVWLGPEAQQGPLTIEPLRLERWRKQPRRTLLHGTQRDGKAAQIFGPPGLGLSVAVFASKGHPSSENEWDQLCAGIRIAGNSPTTTETCLWHCPCDVRFIVAGCSAPDHSLTVRWTLAPDVSQVFFALLPLRIVDKRHVSGTGVMQIRAEIHFHMAVAASPSPYSAPVPAGSHGLALQAIMCGWCLLESTKLKEAAGSKGSGEWFSISRSGVVKPIPKQVTFGSGSLAAPGLLAPSADLPSAFAQEMAPGLMIASEEVMSGRTRLVELHDVGVGFLLEISNSHTANLSKLLNVRKLMLRGCGDTVELIEDPICAEGEEVTAHKAAEMVEGVWQKALNSTDSGSWYALVFPKESKDAETCAALVALVIAHRFKLSTFEEAKHYVRSRWDVAISCSLPCWIDDVAANTGAVIEETKYGNKAVGNLLHAMGKVHSKTGNCNDASSLLAEWSTVAGVESHLSLHAMQEWSKTWQPFMGNCFRVHDTGWGSVGEIFRAAAAGGIDLQRGPLVTFRFENPLKQGEVLHVPHSHDVENDSWHLLAVVCGDALDRQGVVDRFFAFLRGGAAESGASEWILDAMGRLSEVVRNQVSGHPPDHWLCTSDLVPRAVVYVRHERASRRFTPQPGTTSRPVHAQVSPALAVGQLVVRIVTENKLLLIDGGCFARASDVPAIALLDLPPTAQLADLREQVQKRLKIPSDRQHWLGIHDNVFLSSSKQQLFPIPADAPLWSVASCQASGAMPKGTTVTLLLMFSRECAGGVDVVATPAKNAAAIPFLCYFFDQRSLRLPMLGVLKMQRGQSLLHESAWIQNRIAATCVGQSSVPILACHSVLGGGHFGHVRLDWPVEAQPLSFGSALIFEAALCGRPTPLKHGLSDAASRNNFLVAFAGLVRQPPPVHLVGCITLSAGMVANSAANVEAEAWPVVRKAVSEALGKGFAEAELFLPVQLQETRCTIAFRLPLKGNLSQASATALRLGDCFVAPSGRDCMLRGRLAQLKPHELFLTAGTSGGAGRSAWRAVAPGNQLTALKEKYVPNQTIGTCFPAAFAAFSTAVPGIDFDTEVVEICTDTGLEDFESCRARENAESLLAEEPAPEPTTSKRIRRKQLISNFAREHKSNVTVGTRANPPGETEKLAQSDFCTGLAQAMAAEADSNDCLDDAAEESACADSGGATDPSTEHLEVVNTPSLAGCAVVSRSSAAVGGRSSAGSLECSPDVGTAKPGRQSERLAGWNRVDAWPALPGFEGGHTGTISSWSPTHSSPVKRVRASPVSRNRDVSSQFPASSFGQAHLAPNNTRSRTSNGGSTSSTPGRRQTAAKQNSGEEDVAVELVKRMLGTTVEQLSCLLTQARSLNLTEELKKVESQLFSLLIPRTSPQQLESDVPFAVSRSRGASRSSSCGPIFPAPSKDSRGDEVVPRSGLFSRASSCESFFDEAIGREAARFVLASLNATQPSTPRSAVHTPGGCGRPLGEPQQWPEGELEPVVGGLPSSLSPATTPALSPVCPEEAATASERPRSCLDPIVSVGGTVGRSRPSAPDDIDKQYPRSLHRFERRPIGVVGHHLLWHTSPFCISRTPHIPTPVSHCSPARSPTSFSGYCSPIPGLPSGVASPNQRRSQSGYSSPSGSAFFVGPACAQNGLMSRLMSLREARGEEKEDDGEWSGADAREAVGAEETDLLECLLQYAERRTPTRESNTSPNVCLDLRSDFAGVSRRGLLPSMRAPFLNAFVQALLPCSPIVHFFFQLQAHAPQKQRFAHACLAQIVSQFVGCPQGDVHPNSAQVAVAASPFDACAFAEPLLRRFERVKNSTGFGQASLCPTGLGPAPALIRFAQFVFGHLHDECKWATLSPVAAAIEDSPVSRIFGGLLQARQEIAGPRACDSSGTFATPDHGGIQQFLILHLDVATDVVSSVSAAIQNNLLHIGQADFLRLPPCLLIHLQRFKTVEGVPTKVSRHCEIDFRLELEEAANCVLRKVSYSLGSAVCHYGELPEGGTYKAIAQHGGCGSGNDWYVFDDAAVRAKSADDLPGLAQCEGYHVCLLIYRREDTKTVNMRPHAL